VRAYESAWRTAGAEALVDVFAPAQIVMAGGEAVTTSGAPTVGLGR
jgi:hypothetical protein